MKKLITHISFLFVCAIAFSQGTVKRADKFFKSHDFSQASVLYEEYLTKTPNAELDKNLLLKTADAFYFINQDRKAAEYYKKAYKMTDGLHQPYLFRYVRSLRALREYDKADEVYLKYLETKGDRMEIEKFKQDVLIFKELLNYEGESRYSIFNLESNSEFSDFGAVFLNDKVVFSSARKEGGTSKEIYEWNKQPYLSLFIAERSEHGELSDVKLFSRDINSNYHDATFSFSPENNTVYFSSSNLKGRKKMVLDRSRTNNFKLYSAQLVEGNLTDREELFFNSNDHSVGHPCISYDGKYLFFASDMPGGFGEADIYYCEIYDDGKLSEPKNAGSNINTIGNDFFPFFSSENKLYFTSNGHLGFGGLDIYESEFIDGKFSKAINLGKVVNTSYDDFAMIFHEDNKNGYFSSNRTQGKGDDDLYAFFRKPPFCDQYLTGTIKDKLSKEVLSEVNIVAKDSLGNIFYKGQTNQEGVYEIKIPCKQKVKIFLSKEEYVDKSFEQQIGEINEERITVDLYMDRFKDLITTDEKTGIEKINLETIYFDFNSSDITPQASVVLDKAYEVMTIFPNMIIKIEAHTDSRGSDAYNLRLSDSRAKATQEYLYSKGLSRERIVSATGYGESRLLNHCRNGVKCTNEEHDMNRRSDFIVIER